MTMTKMDHQLGIDKIVVHHSASSRLTTLETIRQWHLDRGWPDIGYHFVIEGTGEVRRGRSPLYVGAHALGANLNSIGICVVGYNTETGHTSWAPVQVVALRTLIADLERMWGPLALHAHCDVPGGETATECPGMSTAELRALVWGQGRG